MKTLIKICRAFLSLFKKPKAGITLQQVKDDIASGKCKKIYFAQKTLWWTHDYDDLQPSTDIGLEFCKGRHKAEMKNPKISRENKSRLTLLFNNFMNAKNRPPLDFTGNPLCETTDLKKWIDGAEQNTGVFGRNGLNAFMRMHHKNCQGKAFENWDQVNFDIDGIPVLTNVIEAPVRYMAGRNDLCPCGSGKKFKHCHANQKKS